MRRLTRLGVIAAAMLALAIPAGALSASGAGPVSEPQAAPHDLEHPLGVSQREARQVALEAKLQGKVAAGATTAHVGVNMPDNVGKGGNGQYVELAQTGNDRVFVIIAEFGDDIDPAFGGSPGPEHNEIAQPNRAVDNSTIWQADYNKAHYEDMYFNQMVKYYKAQSSGRYTINGDVIDWVRVPYNEARYGNNACGSSVCSTVWFLIRDAINQWVVDQKAAGKTNAQIKADLDTFDVNDRYDADGDNNFAEPDGYIDHFQIVHAGVGEETGGGAQGTDAIWSHRWYTAYQGIGTWGPPAAQFGGMEFGGDGEYANEGGPDAVGVWVGDYTMQPENGGLGVFAHEYAHDLGLPDQYDTAGGENSTGFWTIMSSGSYLGDGSVNGIGTNPGDFNAWEKFQLGWSNYEVAFAGKTSDHKLGPSERNTKQAQALFVVLPEKKVTVDLGTPLPSGTHLYYSGSGNNLDNTMTKSVTLPAGVVSLTAQVNYDIELDWDYAYLTVNGTAVPTNLSTNTDPNGQNFGQGITGSSGGWTALTADLSAYATQTVTLGFRYWTDGAVVELGFRVDDIQLTGAPLDDAESDFGWTFDGFTNTTGTAESSFFNAYAVENRQYLDYDMGLKTGPYNFGFLNTLPAWVEHFAYQDGILISYWDTSFTDNNTSQHPGGGLILPIDSHPGALMRPNATPWRSRVQAYDSTFGLQPTDAMTLHLNGVDSPIPSLPGVSVFDDRTQYWNPLTPLAGVINPNTGTQIRVKSINANGFAEIQVRTAK